MLLGLVDRHLLRQLTLHLCVIAPGTVAIVWLIQALRLVEVSLERGWSALTVLWLLFLLVWRFVDILLPFAVFVAVVAVLLSLEDSREIEAAAALGYGMRRLVRSVVLFGVLFGLLVWVNALVVAPLAFSQFLELREDRGRELATLFLRPGDFREITPGVTLWMRSVDGAGDLHDLVVYDMRGADEVSVLHARRGRLVESSRGYRLLLVDGSRHRVDRVSDGDEVPSVYWVRFARHELLLEDPVDAVRRLHRIEMSLGGLFDAARVSDIGGDGDGAGAGDGDSAGGGGFLEQLRGEELLRSSERLARRGEFLAEAHRRLSIPLWPVAMCLLGAVAVLGRGRGSRRLRVSLYFVVAFILMLSSALWQDVMSGALGGVDGGRVWGWVVVLYLLPVVTIVLCWFRLLWLDRGRLLF